MDQKLYDDFKQLWEVRRKTEAKAALLGFIASFRSDDERRSWSRWFFDHEPCGDRVRHELYREVLFPTLSTAYRNHEAWCYRYLAQTTQNLYGDHDLWKQLNFVSQSHLIQEWIEAEPESPEARELLLSTEIDWLRHCVHEWPAGILCGMNGATLAECDDILETVGRVSQMTTDESTQAFLVDVRSKTCEYIARLKGAESDS